MNSIFKIYRRNIYGVMGTLLFHILIVSLFLLAEVDMKGIVKEEALIIEFADIVPEIEKEVIDEAANEESIPENTNTRSNIAANRLSNENTTTSAEEFFDNEYLKEIEEAKQLVSDANNQISKEIVDLENIKMPVETTLGMDPDSIKNVIYSGESNIVYYLENRYHKSLPNPLYLAQKGGVVVVDIVVSQRGVVVEAVPRGNNNISDVQIFVYAKAAALRTVFNSEPLAPKAQKGTIHYTFIAQ